MSSNRKETRTWRLRIQYEIVLVNFLSRKCRNVIKHILIIDEKRYVSTSKTKMATNISWRKKQNLNHSRKKNILNDLDLKYNLVYFLHLLEKLYKVIIFTKRKNTFSLLLSFENIGFVKSLLHTNYPWPEFFHVLKLFLWCGEKTITLDETRIRIHKLC